MLHANSPTYRVQTFLIQCILSGYISCYMSAEFQRGLEWSRPLLSLKSKYCVDDFTYYDNDDDDTKADTMMAVVYEVDSDDD